MLDCKTVAGFTLFVFFVFLDVEACQNTHEIPYQTNYIKHYIPKREIFSTFIGKVQALTKTQLANNDGITGDRGKYTQVTGTFPLQLCF